MSGRIILAVVAACLALSTHAAPPTPSANVTVVNPPTSPVPIVTPPGQSLNVNEAGDRWHVTYWLPNGTPGILSLTPSKPGVIEVISLSCGGPGPDVLFVRNWTMLASAPFTPSVGSNESGSPSFELPVVGGFITPTVVRMPFRVVSGSNNYIGFWLRGYETGTCFVHMTGRSLP